MNYQFDLIVIGDSKEGNKLVKSIATTKVSIKIAFVSKEFKDKTTYENLSVDYIKDEVVFTDYKNRLFGCYLKNGDRLYSTHLVFASGEKYAPLMINNRKVPNVFYTETDIPKTAKESQAIVINNSEAEIKLALKIVNKYKHLYICTNDMQLKCSDKIKTKIASFSNVVILPNTSIKDFTTTKGALKTVELDNYSSITCSAIFLKTSSKGDTSYVSQKLIKSDKNGYLEVNKTSESTLVPKCFAIGNCAQKSTKKMLDDAIQEILNDF